MPTTYTSRSAVRVPANRRRGAKSEVVADVATSASSMQAPVAASRTSEAVPDVEAFQLDTRNPDYAYDLYQRSISGIPLLTAEQEVTLARKIRKGDREARDLMIRSNLRLVVKIALDYKNFGLPLLDLINEGNIGLVKAVDRFDPDFGAKLSTYAAFWIKQGIRRALTNQSKTIRLPSGVLQRNSLIKAATTEFEAVHNRPPADWELADALGIPEKELVKWKVRGTARTSSLDAPVSEDNDARSYGETIADERAHSSSQQLEISNRSQTLNHLLEHLDPRERAILNERFGLDGRPERTLEEVGAGMGVTRERIRQIQEIALRKLRRNLETLEAPVRREVPGSAPIWERN
jgi:RNA polymerase primary sigma factor